MCPANLFIRFRGIGVIYVEHCLPQLNCGAKLPINEIAPHLGLSFYVTSLAIEADTTRFFGVVWFAFYAEEMFKFRLVSEHGFTERFVIRDADFNADSALLDKGEQNQMISMISRRLDTEVRPMLS